MSASLLKRVNSQKFLGCKFIEKVIPIVFFNIFCHTPSLLMYSDSLHMYISSPDISLWSSKLCLFLINCCSLYPEIEQYFYIFNKFAFWFSNVPSDMLTFLEYIYENTNVGFNLKLFMLLRWFSRKRLYTMGVCPSLDNFLTFILSSS